jgi:hypothetical protein
MRLIAGALGGRGVNGLKVIASALGVSVGVSGLDHGFFEMLQGNTHTPGFVVQAIGPAQQMWAHGTEEAFTVIPNYLASGVTAMMLGLVTIAWSIGFIDRPSGSRVLLLLGLLLFLTGGGVGMLVFLVFAWAVARRIHRPPTWWRSFVPSGVSSTLSTNWPGLVVTAMALYAFALEVAIVGYVPFVSNPDTALLVCWSALLAMLAALVAALVGASAQELGRAAAAGAR